MEAKDKKEQKSTLDILDQKLEEVFTKHGLTIERTYKTGNFIRVCRNPTGSPSSSSKPNQPSKNTQE